jgi:hypothetical protein
MAVGRFSARLYEICVIYVALTKFVKPGLQTRCCHEINFSDFRDSLQLARFLHSSQQMVLFSRRIFQMRKSVFILAAAATLSVASSAQATINLLVNPGFENGINPGGSTTLVADDETSITGWKVVGAGVNYVSEPFWDAAEGTRSIELLSNNGGIRQRVFGFTPGKRYILKFNVSADPANTSPVAKAVAYTVSVTGGVAAADFYTFVPGTNAPNNMQYVAEEYSFIASQTYQDLLFKASGRNGAFGPVIDSVSVSMIPEPSTWAMLILGFGLVGVASRRRKQTAVVA